MALARLKVWSPGEILTASDLNGEFNNILSNPVALISPLTAPMQFADGTLAAPGIAWANEPNSGLYRVSAGVFGYGVAGFPALAIRATQFALGTGMGLLVQGQATINTVVVAQGVATAAPGPNVSVLGNNMLLFRGPGASSYGTAIIGIADASGAANNVYTWTPNAGSSLGFHAFSQLAGGGQLRILGGGYNTGAGGAGLSVVHGGTQAAGFDMPLTDGTPGVFRTEMRWSIMRAGNFNTAGDMVLRTNSSLAAQLWLRAGWDNTLANTKQASMFIEAQNGGGNAGVALGSGTTSAAIFWTEAGNAHYWASSNGGGPLSGYAMNLSNTGAASAAAFTPVSDADQKEDIQPLANALTRLMQLKGVSYRQKWDKARSVGLLSQDVLPVYPELVGTTKGPLPDDPLVKTLNYNGLIGPIIEAIREIDARVKVLEAAP